MARRPQSRLGVVGLSFRDVAFFVQVARLLDGGKTVTMGDLCLQLADFNLENRHQVKRWLDTIEDRAGEPLIVREEKRGLVGLTAEGRRFLTVARALLIGLDAYLADDAESKPLRVGVAEFVGTYLLHHLLAERDEREAVPEIFEFESRMLEPRGQLAEGQLDLVLAWSHHEPKVELASTPIRGSTTRIRLLYSPQHPFAHWLHRPGGRAPGELRDELRRYPLVYPLRLRPIAELAQQLGGPTGRRIAVHDFPAVVNHVRMGVGIGLFPDWRWVLRQLHRETYLLDCALPADEGLRQTEMQLLYHAPKDRRHPQADAFVARLEQKLRELNEVPADGWLWEPCGWGNPLRDLHGTFQRDWHSHYINTGGGEVPLPHWRQGQFTFEIPAEDGLADPCPLRGVYTMPKRTGEDQAFRLQGAIYRDGLTIISHPEGADRSPPAFLSFARRLRRLRATGEPDTFVDGVHHWGLLGFIHFMDGQEQPTVSPFFMTPPPLDYLTAHEHRQILELVTFLGFTSVPEILR